MHEFGCMLRLRSDLRGEEDRLLSTKNVRFVWGRYSLCTFLKESEI